VAGGGEGKAAWQWQWPWLQRHKCRLFGSKPLLVLHLH